MERERQAEGAKAGGLHQAKRDAHAQLKRLTKDLQARQLLYTLPAVPKTMGSQLKYTVAVMACHVFHALQGS